MRLYAQMYAVNSSFTKTICVISVYLILIIVILENFGAFTVRKTQYTMMVFKFIFRINIRG